MSSQQSTSHNKQPYVIRELSAMACEYGPGMKLPTAQQLAKQLGVTLTTLDRALTKMEANGIVNRRQGSGIYVSNSLLDKRIGLIFGRNIFQSGSSAFYLLLLQHCERIAEDEHHQFSIFLSPNNHHPKKDEDQFNPDLANILKQENLDGLITCEINDQNYANWIASHNIPTVALAPSQQFHSVGLNTKQLIDDSLAHLANQGCRTVGLLGILSQHVKAFRLAAKKHQLLIHEETVIHPGSEKDPPFDTHEQLGQEWMQTCLKRCGGKKGLPDGLLITDDLLARGALLYLKEKRIRPGKNLQIVSHANKGSLSLEYWQDQITLAEVDPSNIVKKLFNLLDNMMQGKEPRQKEFKIPATIKAAPN